MNEDHFFDKSKTCCFTGHRPGNLPGNGLKDRNATRVISELLYIRIGQAADDGFDTFITGMADGIDMLAARQVLRHISEGERLRLVCAVPYAGHIREHRSAEKQRLYSKVLSSAAAVFTLAKGYHHDCYRVRNAFMVSNSSRLIAVYDSTVLRSGAVQTLNMAENAGIERVCIDLNENEYLFKE